MCHIELTEDLENKRKVLETEVERDNIKVHIKKCGGNCGFLVQDMIQWRAAVSTAMKLGTQYKKKYFSST